MTISCPTPTVKSEVASQWVTIGLATVSKPQWFVSLVLLFAMLLQGTASNVVLGVFTLVIGVVAWHFGSDTSVITDAPISKSQAVWHKLHDVRSTWNHQKSIIPKIKFALYLLMAVCGLIAAVNGSIVSSSGKLMVGIALLIATAYFMHVYSKYAEEFSFV